MADSAGPPVGFCLALAVHVIDEAVTGFLRVYNPTVLAFRPEGWWFPPTFEFREWLLGLILAVLSALTLSPFFFHGYRWVRPLGYLLALVAGILNALGHITGTILGHTVSTVGFSRPMPGFYSSPILLAAAVYLLFWLVRSSQVVPEKRWATP
ncbi:MAG TPA: hypothetical protein VIX19_01510 [Terriglobales bacterium]